MVRLNRHDLTKEQLEKIFEQLATILDDKRALFINAALKELLGWEERVMVAKRVAILILLVEGKSSYYISQALKVSPATVTSVHEKLESGGYDEILKRLIKQKKTYVDILNTIDSILHLGGVLPHYNGLDRYRFK